MSPATAAAQLADRPQRFYLLDASRALAAFAVLFWHYQHFYMPLGTNVPAKGYSLREPLHGLFGLWYDHGHFAVPIFWMISGFVFAAVYLSARHSTRAFAVNRFARLYPLHLLTLVLVALLQIAILAKYGTHWVYPYNDAYHFLLQLFFAGSWGLERGASFNGPVWSVSVEVLIYVFFWVVHRWVGRFGLVLPVVLAALFFLLSLMIPATPLLACGQYFFVGVALYIVHTALWREERLLALIVAIAFPIGVFALYRGLMVVGLPGVFGSLLLILCAAERYVAPRARGLLGAVGDTTYGMYLWHVPLQLMLFVLLPAAMIPHLADSLWFLLLFLGGTIAVARISYVAYERPMRDWLRQFARKRVASRPQVGAL
ncbi:acyltransferase [Sphingomonas sp. MMSM20]|uniref:acyltransferase family protein n=1 Tax=Sphingomonas lycopersici TaxID=2951807 RepID=UPI002237A6A7|nr:acyltransferase [Sphingomonas lycopersici]